MIEPDVGDDADLRLDDVGGVKAPAQAGFPGNPVDFFPPEIPERQRGHQLEEGAFVISNLFHCPPNNRHALGKVGLRNRAAVDLDSFAHADQMGRGVKSHPKTGRTEA